MKAQAIVEELRAYMLQEGITADRGVARGFAYEGYENLREGNYERAREAFDLARSFDPYLPQAQLGYAWSLLRAGRGVVTFVSEYRKGLALMWQQFTTDEVQISNFAVIAAIAFLCGLVAISLVVIMRCQGRARHDLFEISRWFLPESAARVASWAIFLLPLLFWAGGVWLVLFWLVLCFRYMRFTEKFAAICIFLMLGLSPLGISVVVDRFEEGTDPQLNLVVRALQGGYNPETLRQLDRLVVAHDDDPELHLLLGTCYAKGDLLSEAFDEYEKVLARNPFSTAGLVNRGNVYCRLGEFGEAVNNYKQAAQIQPDLVSAYWNLYIAQSELMHFEEAESSLATARELNGPLTGSLVARKKGETGAALLIDESASLNRIKQKLRAGQAEPVDPRAALRNPLSIACGASLLLSLITALVGGRKSSRIASACARCGRPHCARCQADHKNTAYCSRCVHLFFKRDGITAEMRAEGLSKLDRRDRLTGIIRRVVSLVAPGAGQILAGRLGVGVPVLTGWVGAIIFILGQDRLLLTPRVPVSDLPTASLGVAALIMLCLWIVGNTVSTRRTALAGLDDGA